MCPETLDALGTSRYRQIIRHTDLAAHERYLARLLVNYRGPHFADWSAELASTRRALAQLARRIDNDDRRATYPHHRDR